MKGRSSRASSDSTKPVKTKKVKRFSPQSARGKMTLKDGMKVDQHGRTWLTGPTGNGKGRDRGKRSVGLAAWADGVARGKYTEPGKGPR